MRLVIDIPDDVYKKTVFYREFKDLNDYVTTLKALENGTPLPKGHGRLIDADAAKEVMLHEMCGTGYQDRAMYVLESELYTPTIIDKD